MNGVFVFPVLWQVYKRKPCYQDQFSWKLFLAFTLALILEIAGVGVLMYLVSACSCIVYTVHASYVTLSNSMQWNISLVTCVFSVYTRAFRQIKAREYTKKI